ncbi:hypothetical protein [Spirochaeta dissipatitropha]
MFLDFAIIIFVVLELSNVLVMYFKPDFRHGNSMAVFKEWEESQEDSSRQLFARYLVNWVANCKLIFIALLLVILFQGDETLKIYSVIATVVSIGIYFVTLHPIIKKLDAMGRISPVGYSRTLSRMISGFMLLFTFSLIMHFIL